MASKQKLLLLCDLSPGDVLMVTAAVRDLHKAYLNKYLTDVVTTSMELWDNNPYITKLNWKHIEVNGEKKLFVDEDEVHLIKMSYTEAINNSGNRPYHFIHGYAQHLESVLNVKIPVTKFSGDIFLNYDETQHTFDELADVKNYWIIVNGGKFDYSTKWPNPYYMQQVVNHFKNKIKFVQCGSNEHWHPRLENVIDMVGKTNGRDFIKLMHKASGVLCPVTFAMHLAAAVPTKYENIPRFCVVIAGGRESTHWEMYPNHQYLHTQGALDCCALGGCWKSKVEPDEKDLEKNPLEVSYLCRYPEQVALGLNIAKCINLITPNKIIDAIELYYQGGLGSYAFN